MSIGGIYLVSVSVETHDADRSIVKTESWLVGHKLVWLSGRAVLEDISNSFKNVNLFCLGNFTGRNLCCGNN